MSTFVPAYATTATRLSEPQETGEPVKAGPDAAIVFPGETVEVTPLANDTPAGLRIIAVTQPQYGSVQVSQDGQKLAYACPVGTPVSIQTVAYTAQHTETGRAGIGIARFAVQDASQLEPDVICSPDSLTIRAGDNLDTEVDVLANDAPQNDTLAVLSVTQPAQGSLSITAGGTRVRYIPPASVAVPTAFQATYTAGKPGGTKTAVGQLAITVLPASTSVAVPAKGPGPRSNLPWHSGANYNVPDLEALRGGKRIDVTLVYGPRETWNDLQGGTPDTDTLDGWFSTGFKSNVGGQPKLVLAWPLLPTEANASPAGGDPANWDKAANGDFDLYYRRFAEKLSRLLQASGREDVGIMVAHEANTTGYPWSIGAKVDSYIRTFRRAVDILRTHNPKAWIVWCMDDRGRMQDYGYTNADCYPGDAYVDVIGVSYFAADLPAEQWLSGPIALNSWRYFATSRGKLFAVPRWGLAHQPRTPLGLGDSATFIADMHAFFTAQAGILSFECYHNREDSQLAPQHATYPNPLGAAKYAELWGGVTPVAVPPTAKADSFTVEPGTTTELDVLANDQQGSYGIDPDRLEITQAPGLGSASVVSGKISYTAPADPGSTSLQYRVGDTGGLWSSAATVALTIRAGNTQGDYAHLAVPQVSGITAADIDTLDVTGSAYTNGTYSKGSASKYLLVYQPASAATIPGVFLTDLRYKGVFLIGATFRGGNSSAKATSSGTGTFLGGDIIRVTWDETITHKPFLFLANLLYDSAAHGKFWGDFINAGTPLKSGENKDNPATLDWSNAPDIYVNKVLIPRGHWGWTTSDGDYAPHSDFHQSKSGKFGSLYASEVDVRWGYQTFFSKGVNLVGDNVDPSGVVSIKKTVFRWNAANPKIYGGSGYQSGFALKAVHATDFNDQRRARRVILDQVYTTPTTNPANDSPTSFFYPRTGIAYAPATGLLTFPTTTFTPYGSANVPSPAARKRWDAQGEVRHTSTPPVVVSASQVGAEKAVRTANDLVAVIEGWSGSGTGGTGGTGGGNELPAQDPAKTVTVSSASALESAIANAGPGWTIIVQDGANFSYGGKTISKSGSASAPLVIRAKTVGKATISGDFTISGSHIRFWGFDRGGGRTTLSGNEGIWFMRNRCWSTSAGNVVTVANGKHRICYNYLRCGPADQEPWASGGLFGQIDFGGNSFGDSRGTRIDHNHFDRGVKKKMPYWGVSKDYHLVKAAGIRLGEGENGGLVVSDVLIDHNLFTNNGDCEVSIKAKRTKVISNTILGHYCFIRFREGGENQAIGNWVDVSDDFGILVMGADNVVAFNRVTTGIGCTIGEEEPYTTGGKNLFKRSLRTYFGGNVSGKLVIGATEGRPTPHLPATNTVIRDHKNLQGVVGGGISFGKHQGTDSKPAAPVDLSRTGPRITPRKLTAADVGPSAPWQG